MPEYDPSLIQPLYRHIKKFVTHPTKMTPQEYIDTMGTKKPLYQNAYDTYLGDKRIRYSIKPFTKLEKMPTSKYKPPRMIQARHPIFNIHYGVFIKPLEIKLCKYNKRSCRHFGKGNYDEIAAKIKYFKNKYRYYTEADHKEFDAHVTPQMLRLTHIFYESCYGHDPKLRALSKRTITNTCITRDGDKYRVYGTRMSGDVDTSLGNSLINYAIIKEVLDRLGIRGDAIVNGDDSIIFSDQPIPNEATELFKRFNMETKMKPSQENICKVEFCRTKYVVKSNGVPTMMMDPQRIYEIFGMTHSNKAFSNYTEYLYEVAFCNSIINSNTPMGKAWQLTLNNRFRSKIERQDYSLKYVEDNIKRSLLSQRNLEPSLDEFTYTMFQAWPLCVEYYNKIQKICFRPRATSVEIYINHDNEKLFVG